VGIVLCACRVEQSGPAPDAPATCTGDATACLSGKAVAKGFTGATPTVYQARLFREFPIAGANPVATAFATADGTYAFSALPAWNHYFVQVAAQFGSPVAVGAVVGPLSVPSTGPVDVTIQPVQLNIVHEAPAGQAMQLTSALAYVFDPVDGSPAKGASVTIEVGGSQVAMQESAQGGAEAYSASFPASTPAQSTYTVTVLMPGLGQTPATYHAASGTASFTPSLSAPGANATVPKGQPLAVSWTAQPQADEELVVLYAQTQGTWGQAYMAPAPADADATTATVPASAVTAGPLLVNVLFAAASCPADQAGCVVNDETAAVQVTAQ
jgi:hypothetical protein